MVSAHCGKKATGLGGDINHSNHGILGPLKIDIKEVTNNSAISGFAKICLQPPNQYSWHSYTHI